MDHFHYQNAQLFAEQVAVQTIAERYGTPCYVYSRATLERHFHAFDHAFGDHPHQVCYAVKANSNLAILNVLARLGAGFDIVSIGELERVLAAGGDPQRVVFSGVAKRRDEILRALEVGIGCFNVESEKELEQIAALADMRQQRTPIALRVNPDVDAHTHPYIATGLRDNKFGIPMEEAFTVYQRAAQLPALHIQGIACHIGSQLTQVAPFVEALSRVLRLVEQLESTGILLEHLDMGGGLGVCYRDEQPPSPAEQIQALLAQLGHRHYPIFIEPGRAIVGNAGILVTRIELIKHNGHKNFAIVDAAMNDLIRPALYAAWQAIWPVVKRTGEPRSYDVVGPVCETGDFLGKDRLLTVQEGDLLAIRTAGAYGFVMSSNYNTRPRAAEVMVDGDQTHLIRPRETIASLYADEVCLP